MRVPIRILSLNTGVVQPQIDARGRSFKSAIRRQPQGGPRELGVGGFAGDASAYTGHHGPNMAVSVFSFDRYAHFEALAKTRLPVPAFGENFTTARGLETEVCIGDVYAIGTALLAVTQPTERCATPGRALGLPSLRAWTIDCLYSGYYMSVVRAGAISAGDTFELVTRPLSQWTVDRVNRCVFRDIGDEYLVAEMLALEQLSPEWKARVRVLRTRREAKARRSERPLLPNSS